MHSPHAQAPKQGPDIVDAKPNLGDGGQWTHSDDGHPVEFLLRWIHEDRSDCRAYELTLHPEGRDGEKLHTYGPHRVDAVDLAAGDLLHHLFDDLAQHPEALRWSCEIRAHYDTHHPLRLDAPVGRQSAREESWVYVWEPSAVAESAPNPPSAPPRKKRPGWASGPRSRKG